MCGVHKRVGKGLPMQTRLGFQVDTGLGVSRGLGFGITVLELVSEVNWRWFREADVNMDFLEDVREAERSLSHA